MKHGLISDWILNYIFYIFRKYEIIISFLLSVLSFSAFTQDPLRVLMIFAHPDEGEVYSGGITALYTQLGYEVKFLSLTNGDAGHFFLTLEEVQASKELQAEYLFNNAYDWSHITPEIMTTLRYWYGADRAGKVNYVEAYEVAEYGRQITKEEVWTLFPMIDGIIDSDVP